MSREKLENLRELVQSAGLTVVSGQMAQLVHACLMCSPGCLVTQLPNHN